nr:hypothetical protein [Tanacetum cinerariifolium]GEZ55548.1 hypothetical protein [Tanacetum cinerariifolium]
MLFKVPADVVAVIILCRPQAKGYAKHDGERTCTYCIFNVPDDVVGVRFLCTPHARVYAKHNGDNIIVISIDDLAIKDNVSMRRMEEIDVKLFYDAWRGICVTKYDLSDRPPPKMKRTSCFFGDLFSIQMWNEAWKATSI